MKYFIIFLVISVGFCYVEEGTTDTKPIIINGSTTKSIPVTEEFPPMPPVNSTTESPPTNTSTTTVISTTKSSSPNPTTSLTSTSTSTSSSTSTSTSTSSSTSMSTSSTSVTPPRSSTAIPVTTAKPLPHGRRFDGPSFVGGIVLALGLVAIGFVGFKFYKARTELNYHTL